tara:strand:+ start:111 stop:257 length:147 start_codon:yes stop_codon:yes gene_type:complete
MKIDIFRLIIFVWMAIMLYFMYYMYVDLKYITELVHGYIQMVLNHSRH